MNLTGRNIVLGVTGGIAAYKSAVVVSRLRHLGANVHVIMTKNAAESMSSPRRKEAACVQSQR